MEELRMEVVLFDAEDPVKDDKAPAETTIDTAKAAMGGYVGNINTPWLG